MLQGAVIGGYSSMLAGCPHVRGDMMGKVMTWVSVCCSHFSWRAMMATYFNDRGPGGLWTGRLLGPRVGAGAGGGGGGK